MERRKGVGKSPEGVLAFRELDGALELTEARCGK